ncbi:MAG TPA: AEC family transporter [Fusobacterium sp.]|uniref:AEC family transporter n=1 Tax=Fusobacterium sp. TaxID=68766 RepID=UPI002F40952D
MWIIIQKMLLLLCVSALGYWICKVKLITLEHNRGYSILISNVTVPCMVIFSIFSQSPIQNYGEIFSIFGVGFLFFGFFTLCSLFMPILFQAKNEEIGIYRFMTVFNNNSFMGFPIIQSVFGNKYLFYAAILNIVNALYLYTYGMYCITREVEGYHFDWKKLCNPGMVVSVISLILYLFHFSLPEFFLEISRQVGNITTPLSMLVIGVNLSMIPFREVFSETKLYLFSFFRLLVFPLVLWFLLKGFMENTDFLIVVLVTAAMPGAAMMVNLATEYEGNVYFASKYLVLSTLLSVIIVPVVIYVLQNYV